MTELLIVMVISFLVVAAAKIVGPHVGVASPLILVAIGVAASFLPIFSSIEIEPELVLEIILPPLLYAAAASMPTRNFRREFGAISGLSVLLLIGSALALGLFFALLIPGLGFAWGLALGAIVSPTDAVATSIIKKTSVTRSIVTLLDGESLLNDATALVLLRTAIVAAAAGFSFWGAAGTFVYAVAVAGVIGWLVGWLNLELRKHVTDPTANTVISFTVPFVASVPAAMLGASGLVAAVVAGLILSRFGPRYLPPQSRLSDLQNWRSIEFILEGGVFLLTGLQITQIVESAHEDELGVVPAIVIAVAALVLTVLLRMVYIAPLLGVLHLRSKRREKSRTLRPRTQRSQADDDYFLHQRLGWREGATMVWAGMRGAITVAAAQTLPADAPFRSSLILIAFTVAVLSLMIQGGTLGPFLRLIKPRLDHTADDDYMVREQARVADLVNSEVARLPEPPAPLGEPPQTQSEAQRRYRLDLIDLQRSALLDARDEGILDTEALAEALAKLDADQIALQVQTRSARDEVG